MLGYDATGKLVSAKASMSPSLAADLAQAITTLLTELTKLTTLTSNNGVQSTRPVYRLKPVAGPRYWQPREPVVLMVGPAVQPNKRYMQATPLPCQLLQVTEANAQTLFPQQLATVLSGIDAINAIASAASDSVGFSTWQQQPWNPFLLEWEVEVFPLSNQSNLQADTETYQPDFITSNFALHENQPDLAFLAGQGSLVKAVDVYSGSTILTSYAQNRLKDLLAAYLADAPVNNTEYLKSASAKLNDPGFCALSQSLGGFNEALLMRKQTLQLEINDPLGFSDYQSFTQTVHDAVQGQSKSAPEPQWDFNPLRSGSMRILHLRLIDTFGQVRNLRWENVITTEQMTSIGSNDWVWLPPRLAQPARCNFRWLAANADQQEMNDHPATTPICGWVLPNNLDNNLQIYDNQGTLLGIINEQAQWESAPGSQNIKVEDILNPHLRQMVNYIINPKTQQESNKDFLANFITSLDTALANIDPENFAQHQDLALLMGRPIALVRASLNI